MGYKQLTAHIQIAQIKESGLPGSFVLNVNEVSAMPDRCVLSTALAMSKELADEVGDHGDVRPWR